MESPPVWISLIMAPRSISTRAFSCKRVWQIANKNYNGLYSHKGHYSMLTWSSNKAAHCFCYARLDFHVYGYFFLNIKQFFHFPFEKYLCPHGHTKTISRACQSNRWCSPCVGQSEAYKQLQAQSVDVVFSPN